MTGKPYTDSDVKLVALTFIAEAKKNPVDPATPPWMGAQTRMLLGPTEHDIARAVLDILARAGRLKPATTEDQVRAGADALVRLRTTAPSLSELDGEEQAFWLRDARAVLEAAGPLAGAGRCGDRAPTIALLASTVQPTCCLTAGHAGWHRGDDGSEWIEHGTKPADGRPAPHLDAVKAQRGRLAAALADCVVKATPYGIQDGDFIANYISPTGPIHRAIPLLQEHGITVRPGFDGRTASGADEPVDADAVQNLLDDATRAFAAAGTSSERQEVIRDLLAAWYAAWPASAVTDEHEGIAHQIVALVYAAEARAGTPVDGRSRQVADSILANARADADRAHRMHDEASDEVDRLNVERRLLRRHLTALADRMTARASEADAPDGLAMGDFAESIRALVNHRANAKSCPCGPGAPAHLHGVGGYSASAELAAEQHHVIAFAGDGTWSLEHPATCQAENDAADAADWDCPVRKLAERGVAGQMAGPLASGRYECWANRLGDVFLLGDRVDPAEGGCERCAAHLICPTHDDPRRSEG